MDKDVRKAILGFVNEFEFEYEWQKRNAEGSGQWHKGALRGFEHVLEIFDKHFGEMIEHAKVTKETADKLGIAYNTLYNRVHVYGWDVEKALNTPKMTGKSIYNDYRELANENGIGRDTFNYRVRSGMTPLEASTTPRKRSKTKRKIPVEYIEKAKENGICLNTLKARFYSLNWSLEDASTRPLRKGWKGK